MARSPTSSGVASIERSPLAAVISGKRTRGSSSTSSLWQRPALLHREAGHALAHPDADPARRLAGRGRGSPPGTSSPVLGVEGEHAARLHAEHLARLLEDHADGLADLEALAHRPPRLEQRLGLPRPRRWLSSNSRAFWMAMPAWSAKASSSVWSRGAEEARRAGERGEHADGVAARRAAARTSSERMPSSSSTSREAERGSSADVVHADRRALAAARADDAPRRPASPARDHVRGPEAVGGDVLDRGAVGVEQPDAAAGAADEAGDGAADRVQHRAHVEPRGDELRGLVERGQGSRARPTVSACRRRVLDRGGERPRHLGERLDVAVGERARRAMGHVQRADRLAAGDQRARGWRSG